MSDSCYASLRHRRPLTTSGRPPTLDVIDDAWASATLSDDEIDVERHETTISTLLDEDGEELDIDAVIVPPPSGSNPNGRGGAGGGGSRDRSAAERRRREEGRWNDLGLDSFDVGLVMPTGGGGGSGGATGGPGIGSGQ